MADKELAFRLKIARESLGLTLNDASKLLGFANYKTLSNTNALDILTSHVVIASPMGVPARRSAYLQVDSSSEHALRHAGVAISFFLGLLRRYAPRKDKSFIAFV